MGIVMSRALSLAALAAAAATPWPASAQCRLCDKPEGARPDRMPSEVQLQIETSIDFDRLVLFGAGDGAAVIRPDGSSAAQGRSAGSVRARWSGPPRPWPAGRAVRIELPRADRPLFAGGGRIRFDEVVSDLPAIPHLDWPGTSPSDSAGGVRITGEADGAYRGDLPITVEYQ